MSFAVVGGIALDSISIAGGAPREVLGGSAVYSGLAAAVLGEVAIAGIVGSDQLVDEYLAVLGKHPNIELDVVVLPGSTTRFRCDYDRALGTRTTLAFSPGVAGDTGLPMAWPRASDVVFLGSGSPSLQMAVLGASQSQLVAIDTIDHWIALDKAGLERVMKCASIVFMNAEEVVAFVGHHGIADAASKVLDLGPRLLCVKQGEFGVRLYSAEGWWLALPAYPSKAVDPTGAGDAFAGSFLRYLSLEGGDVENRRVVSEALIVGTAVSSICVESFGTEMLERATLSEVSRRCRSLLEATACSRQVLATLQRLAD